ncbi:MAG TPA: DUF6496 domain-containing protein [Ferruginibacter sp.]|nr:DUF6496 domain-containing protein [Ferruginibacter sp.]
MAKYSKGAGKGVESAVKRMKKGTLRSGGSGKKVTSRKQAIAIGLSEARKKGAKVPTKKAAAKKSTTKKAAPKKKAASKRSAPKKAAAKKRAPAKKSPVKKAAPKKKAASKKSAPKKAASKRSATRSKPAAAGSAGSKNRPAPTKMKPADTTEKEQLPPKTELSEEMHEEGVREENEEQSMMQSGQGAEILEKKEDPIMAFDMHMAQKATAKGDRNNKLRVSSTGQRPIRPSGKKPLWRK